MDDLHLSLEEARSFTSLLHDSVDEYWPLLREHLRQMSIDPMRAVIGGVDPDQEPIVVVVTPEGRALATFLGQGPIGGTPPIGHTERLDDPESRFPWSSEIYAGLVLVNEQSPSTVDPLAVLAEATERMSLEVRAGDDWEPVRSFLREHGMDPTHVVVVEWHDIIRNERRPERHCACLVDGRWLEFDIAMTPSLNVVAVASWRESDETLTREAYGSRVDAALRVSSGGRES